MNAVVQLPPSEYNGSAENTAQMDNFDITVKPASKVDLATVAEAVEEVRAGRFVIVMDNEDRENEGDLMIAARFATAERVAFAVRYTTGILCAPMTPARAVELQLPPMVVENKDPKGNLPNLLCPLATTCGRGRLIMGCICSSVYCSFIYSFTVYFTRMFYCNA